MNIPKKNFGEMKMQTLAEVLNDHNKMTAYDVKQNVKVDENIKCLVIVLKRVQSKKCLVIVLKRVQS